VARVKTFEPLIQMFLHDPENGQYGDCHRTAIAMCLGLAVEDVPHFCDPALFNEWRSSREIWLNAIGISAVEMPFSCDLPSLLAQLELSAGASPIMVAGMSPRGTYHETVLYQGVLYDPHPAGGGIVAPCDDGGFWWVTILTLMLGFVSRHLPQGFPAA
jgi:hypothetical protein